MRLVLLFSGLLSVHFAPTTRVKLWQNRSWRLCSVQAWSVSVCLGNIFCSYGCPDMSDNVVYWKLSAFVCSIFVRSVCICTIICVLHRSILLSSVFTLFVFHTQYSVVFVDSVITCDVPKGQRHSAHEYCIVYPVLFQPLWYAVLPI